MILVPGPRAGTPGLRMTFAAVTDLALQLHPCVDDLQQLFSLWDDEEVSHGTFTLTDLRKALPVVGVSAHPVDVQLLFDALDRHHHGHAAYGNLGARLAHVAGMVGAPTPSYDRRASLPVLAGLRRGVGGVGAKPARRSTSIDSLPSLAPPGGGAPTPGHASVPGGGFGREARFGRREDALGGREAARFSRWEERRWEGDPASHGGNHARQGGGGEGARRRRRGGRTVAAEGEAEAGAEAAEREEGEGEGAAAAAGEEQVPPSMVLPTAARLIMKGNQAGDVTERTLRETLRGALTNPHPLPHPLPHPHPRPHPHPQPHPNQMRSPRTTCA